MFSGTNGTQGTSIKVTNHKPHSSFSDNNSDKACSADSKSCSITSKYFRDYYALLNQDLSMISCQIIFPIIFPLKMLILTQIILQNSIYLSSHACCSHICKETILSMYIPSQQMFSLVTSRATIFLSSTCYLVFIRKSKDYKPNNLLHLLTTNML